MDLRRIYRNFEECPSEVKLTVKGVIPHWLQGVFLRVGPALYDLDGTSVNHWFDGFAMLQNFIIKNGEVSFRSKFLQSDSYRKAMEHQRLVYHEFGTRGYPDLCKNIFSRFFSHFTIPDLTDNDLVNVYPVQDAIFSATEGHLIHRVDPLTLNTMERVDLAKLVAINLSTAHPHFDPDGTMYNLGTSFTSIKYHVVKFPPDKSSHRKLDGEKEVLTGGKILCQIPFSWKTYFTYFHSFSMTTNYVIFLEQPLLVNTLKLIAAKYKGRCFKDCFEWLPEEKARFYIVDKKTGITWKTKFYHEAFFTFHHVNAYEEDGHIVVDIITYPDPEVIDQLYLANLRTVDYDLSPLPQMRRFVLPLISNIKDVKTDENLVRLPKTSAKAFRKKDKGGIIWLESEEIAPPGFELPQINYKFHSGRKYRYVYATGLIYKGIFQNGVTKVDLETKQFLQWKGDTKTIVGEPVFVPHPDAQEEDDGVLMAIVLRLTDEMPDGVIFLDAKTMKEVGRAELSLSIPLPPLLHGTYLPAGLVTME